GPATHARRRARRVGSRLPDRVREPVAVQSRVQSVVRCAPSKGCGDAPARAPAASGLTQGTSAYTGSALPGPALGNSRARKAEALAWVDSSPVTRGIPTVRRLTSFCSLRSDTLRSIRPELTTATPFLATGSARDGRQDGLRIHDA